MAPKTKPNREPAPYYPLSVVPLGIWLRAGQVIEAVPEWNYKTQRYSYKSVTVTHASPGAVTIKSGAIAAGDPFVMKSKTYERKVSNGRHPVLFSKVRLGREDIIAAATVVLSSGQLDRFELARVDARERFFQSYAVDSATGSFHDPTALPLFGAHLKERSEVDLMVSLAPGLSLVLDKKAGLNVVGFKSGFGDGMYCSYWGLNAKGKVLCLTTDYGVVSSFEGLDQFKGYGDLEVRLVRRPN